MKIAIPGNKSRTKFSPKNIKIIPFSGGKNAPNASFKWGNLKSTLLTPSDLHDTFRIFFGISRLKEKSRKKVFLCLPAYPLSAHV